MRAKTVEMLAVGDIAYSGEAKDFFDATAPVLKSADIVIGQLEVPYTTRHPQAANLGRDPALLEILASVGFDVLTLAGNHIADAGREGIEDTIRALKQHNMVPVGAGLNIREARKAAILEREGIRFGFLDYNCVGPKETWAAQDKPGCAYIGVHIEYETIFASPGAVPIVKTWAEANTLQAMQEDIHMLRPQCDVLVVNFHKGVGHTPVVIADYEYEICHAAIDAGADVIFSHHAHILKGVEVYKGKTIFHGLGNFVTYVPPHAFNSGHLPKDWGEKRKKLFGFEPDPEYPTYPFHPDAKYTMIAKCWVEEEQIVRTGYIPCEVTKAGYPVIRDRAQGEKIFDYVATITAEAGLKTQFEWQGDQVLIKID